MTRTVPADYLVVGAGAVGMAFTDALVAHADVRVALVDRRPGAGGHWLNAYPFVRLHQASQFYGVPSTLLGEGRRQHAGPEAGLHERADQPTIVAYFAAELDRLVATGRVSFFPGCEVDGDRTWVSSETGERFLVGPGCRVVDAGYLAPSIPAEAPPPFAVDADARVVAVNALPALEERPERYVVVGSGKTATDACVWLLQEGVAPDALCWVRPRDPWMLDRAKVQPDPTVFLGMAADVMAAAAGAESLPALFAALEDAGVLLRIDRSVTPTMAKTPTLATWELDLLRSIEHVVRAGHVTAVHRDRVDLAGGSVRVGPGAVVVHCAADGLRTRPPLPIWRPEAITPQPVRAGFPCLGAALVGYVEATRTDDAEKNRACRPSSYGNSRAEWARMTAQGARNTAALAAAAPDAAAWANTLALNPARVPAEVADSAAVTEVLTRVREVTPAGVAALERLSR